MPELKYFKDWEFKCCSQNCSVENAFDKMNTELLEKLDMAREVAKIPFRINSSYRCEKKNQEVGGKMSSAHLFGQAVDIKCENSVERHTILGALIKVGFTRIGIAKNFIHADVSKTLPQNVLWLY